MDDRVLVEIASMFAAHGVQTSFRGEWLVPMSAPGPAIRAVLAPELLAAKGASVRLEVEFAVSDQHQPLECFAGLGTTVEDAEKSAFDNFMRSALHVALAAFYGQVDPDQVTIERWRVSDVQYQAIIGNYTTRTFGGGEAPIPEQLFPCVENLIHELPGTEPLYWVRVFYCNMNPSDRVTEVLLNNEEWTAAQSAVSALPWKPSETYYSIRLFLVLKREP